MEIELIDRNEQIYKDYYKLEFEGQKVEELSSFKEWYENNLEEIKIKNNESFENRWGEVENIFYCPNCISYTRCINKDQFSVVECLKCRKLFCPACNYIANEQNTGIELSFCLKGYWMLWWLRTKNRLCGIFNGSELLFYILHIIFCIFCTPFYLGFISFFIGLFNHSKNYNEEKAWKKIIPVVIYCLLFGLLTFPYILILVPIMILILIPGIFYHRYYIYIFTAYNTAVMPGQVF